MTVGSTPHRIMPGMHAANAVTSTKPDALNNNECVIASVAKQSSQTNHDFIPKSINTESHTSMRHGHALAARAMREQGIALIIVLWLLALLSLIASTYAAATRTEIHSTMTLLHRAEARALAEAGIWRGALELTRPYAEQTWHHDGRPNRVEFNGHRIEVAIQDEAGKIDLNTAHAELIDGLLSAVNIPQEQRLGLVDAIMDWRDRDELRRPHGAESEDYRRAGYDYGAKNGPFNSVEELQLVMGMDHEIYRHIAPALTVYSHQPGIYIETAVPLALLALPGVGTETVQRYLAERQRDTGTTRLTSLDGAQPRFLSRTRGRAYTIHSSAGIGATRSAISAVIALQPDRGKPFTVLAWIPDPASPATSQLEIDMNPAVEATASVH